MSRRLNELKKLFLSYRKFLLLWLRKAIQKGKSKRLKKRLNIGEKRFGVIKGGELIPWSPLIKRHIITFIF
jgi:hypothetical protein